MGFSICNSIFPGLVIPFEIHLFPIFLDFNRIRFKEVSVHLNLAVITYLPMSHSCCGAAAAAAAAGVAAAAAAAAAAVAAAGVSAAAAAAAGVDAAAAAAGTAASAAAGSSPDAVSSGSTSRSGLNGSTSDSACSSCTTLATLAGIGLLEAPVADAGFFILAAGFFMIDDAGRFIGSVPTGRLCNMPGMGSCEPSKKCAIMHPTPPRGGGEVRRVFLRHDFHAEGVNNHAPSNWWVCSCCWCCCIGCCRWIEPEYICEVIIVIALTHHQQFVIDSRCFGCSFGFPGITNTTKIKP